MALGGVWKQIKISGRDYEVKSDMDSKLELGGFHISESTDTNKGSVDTAGFKTGRIDDLELIVSARDGSLEALREQCENSLTSPRSFSGTLADGTKVSAKGGVKIVADDTSFSTKDSTFTISLVAAGGRFILQS